MYLCEVVWYRLALDSICMVLCGCTIRLSAVLYMVLYTDRNCIDLIGK